MAETSITLTPHHYDKIGVVHCGVAHEGRVAVAGDVAHLADGEEHYFPRADITVRRQGSEYIFTRGGTRQAAA
jgi:hypothetical protein